MKEVTYGAIADSKASFNNSGSRYAQTTKELNIVRLKNGFITYHFGLWSGNESAQGFCLNYSEIKQLVRELRKEDILKENELEKFQKDFIQQIHNGTVQKEKEIDLV